MNPAFLLRHFPEIHHLPKARQLEILEAARQNVNQSKKNLRIWLRNLLGFGFMLALCLLIILFLGPAAGLAPNVTGIAVTVIVLPIAFYIQHKSYMRQLTFWVAQQIKEDEQ